MIAQAERSEASVSRGEAVLTPAAQSSHDKAKGDGNEIRAESSETSVSEGEAVLTLAARSVSRGEAVLTPAAHESHVRANGDCDKHASQVERDQRVGKKRCFADAGCTWQARQS